MTPHPWYARIIELAVTSLCVIGVLLALAHDRTDGDELYKGAAAAIGAFIGGNLLERFRGLLKGGG